MFEAEGANRSYGCVYCLTGKELASARHIERTCPDVHAIVARQMKQKSFKGNTCTEESSLFPGYVFFKAPTHFDLARIPRASIISVLTSGAGNWQLYGSDAHLVEWLFSYDGLVSFSKAYQEGERIRIISGPLKDMEGQILRIDKRNRSGQVGITICNRLVKVWLKFEIVDKVS